jgi:hypothetical protein
MTTKKVRVTYSREYLLGNRDALQRAYDERQRFLLLQAELTERWGKDRTGRAGPPSDTRVMYEDVVGDRVVFWLASGKGRKLMMVEFDIIAGHVILGTPWEVTRTVTYTPVNPGEPALQAVPSSDR